MINRIHFNAFGEDFYPGGAYNRMCFLFKSGWACNWANSFPRSSPTHPYGAERFVSFPRP